MMEFTFDSSAWELYLTELKDGETVSASYLLTLMEGETEEAVEDAFAALAEKNARLELSDLPRPRISGDTGLRLKQEAEFAKQGMQPAQLEETDPLRLYLEELAGVPAFGDICLLAGRLAEEGVSDADGENLRVQIMNLSLSRVVQMAGTFTGWGVPLLDLIQEGSLSLWSATEEYKGNGLDFENFRDGRMELAMKKAVFFQARADGVGQKMRQALEDYRAVDERLLAELGRNPTLEEIGEQLHRTAEETAVLAELLENVRRMDRAKPEEKEEPEPQEEEQSVENTAYFRMRQRIGELLSALSEEDARLLTLRFGLEGGLPLTPEETGRKLGITAAEVVAREAAALTKLRNEK